MIDEFLAPILDTKRGQQAGWLLLVFASLLLLYTLIAMVYTWHADLLLARMPTTATAQVFDSTHTETALMEALPTQHLFGLAADEDTDFLPITSLQLHLTGVVKNSDDKTSKAIISEAGQPGKLYTVGDELTAGIRIYSITDDGIVLEHNGRLEKLPLARPRLQFQDAPQALW